MQLCRGGWALLQLHVPLPLALGCSEGFLTPNWGRECLRCPQAVVEQGVGAVRLDYQPEPGRGAGFRTRLPVLCALSTPAAQKLLGTVTLSLIKWNYLKDSVLIPVFELHCCCRVEMPNQSVLGLALVLLGQHHPPLVPSQSRAAGGAQGEIINLKSLTIF